MAPQVASAYIAGSAALLGAILAGIIAVVTQKVGQNAETRRRRAEVEERARTRFHDSRLRVYSEFVESTDKTFRLHGITGLEIRASALGEDPETAAIGWDRHGLDGFSSRETDRLYREVVLLTRSTAVEQAAMELMRALLSDLGITADVKDLIRLQVDEGTQFAEARDEFIRAARDELDG
ncbi:hypothetical protein HH310_06920 [Actinoplanes sp. TBRC 11911]|uniref:hypothetical protein n=1 Tax=Actinoplanes sp. TBRC 11911 TaxID=2729386 RepID=UPI00145CD3EC|nr:hypothetical protein [Actinoplanes sp. TBRC 11911]NMO50923.1 hypothetical protein [Actinoplanes sp. TBRC 11911]